MPTAATGNTSFAPFLPRTTPKNGSGWTSGVEVISAPMHVAASAAIVRNDPAVVGQDRGATRVADLASRT